VSKIHLSALIPVYNEEENLSALGEEVSAALESLGKPYEVILVDDGSKDRSYEEILKLVERHKGFKAVRLGRNAGQTAAMLAGVQHASGDLIVCLDADMQTRATSPSSSPRWTRATTPYRAGAATARTASSTASCPP
jgi:glycosyltransferase involved in cell wall biosynthesis